METECIYWPHPTPVGIKVEEISGMENRSGEIWRRMALQVYCENGKDGFREIGHFANGAPFLFGQTSRISITHTGHLLAVATLPKTPEANLSEFNPRTAMGIDAECLDRSQVLRIRERFLSESELELIPADSLEKNIIAWTAKEALYKAAMTEGIDFRNAITLEQLPEIDRKMNLPGAPAPVIGKASVVIGSERYDFHLYSYESDGCCVTLAFSPKCAKFGRNKQ
ncbi:MAG: 4'-phosphopantetheinyl transferase superfamily protein [Muribaculaceae bacterium]|nr:4'-phosphopantetheinyl transferase superfamily protein [Muribaculaceae bacterium]